MKKLAHLLTSSRLALTPFVLVFISEGHWVPALLCHLLSGLTDALDGFVARKFSSVSRFGSILDGVADKVYAISLFTAFFYLGRCPLVYLLILTSLAAIQLVGLLWIGLFSRIPTLTANRLGKWGQAGQFAWGAILILPLRDLPIEALHGMYALLSAAHATSLFQYFMQHQRNLGVISESNSIA